MSGNAQAFGFSITVTVTFGVLTSTQDPPTRPELIGFALSGVAAFSLLNLLAVYLPTSHSGAEPTRVLLLATATDFLAVGGGVGTAMGINAVFSGWVAWVLSPFCAGLVYVLVQGIELAVGQHSDEDNQNAAPPSGSS